MIESKVDTDPAKPESVRSSGLLVVITGASGVGKDSIADSLLIHPSISHIKFRRLITCADRLPRLNERHGVDYYFVTPEELDHMDKNGELVEQPQPTGTSRKGTQKKELLSVLSGENLIWRIDPYLASKVASGEFFQEQFTGEEGKVLQALTKVFCIYAPDDALAQRRKNRDGKAYSHTEYELRDTQEKPILEKLIQISIVIENNEGLLTSAVEQIIAQINSKIPS